MPKVSVCVPIYNVEKYIEKCVRSLFEQTLDDIEYVFVNDCTPDKSMDILRQVLIEYPHRQEQVKIIDHKVNKGLAAVRNTCLSAATGEYIIHCDSDDWVEPTMYEIMYRKATEENADIVCCNYIDERPNSSKEFGYSHSPEISDPHFDIHPLYCALWNKLIRRKLYIDYGIKSFAKVNMWEDVGTTVRLLYFSQYTVKIPAAFYHYNRTSITFSNQICKERIEDQIRCADNLQTFFQKQGNAVPANHLLSLIKCRAKFSFLWYRPTRNIALWKHTFPEINRNILSFSTIPLHQRIAMWMVAHGFTRSGIWAVDLLNKLYSLKEACM